MKEILTSVYKSNTATLNYKSYSMYIVQLRPLDFLELTDPKSWSYFSFSNTLKPSKYILLKSLTLHSQSIFDDPLNLKISQN